LEKIIEIESLTKAYISKKDKLIALNNINFEMYKGEFIGIIGPNGAGKTTLIKVICGLLLPTKFNKFRVFDSVFAENSKQIRKKIGLLLDSTQLYDELTARENLTFFTELYGLGDCLNNIEATLRRVGLYERRDDYVKNYSTGMKQRLNIARAIVTDAQLLILDEPTSGLDPVSARAIYEILNELNNNGISIILTSHKMSEVEELCNRVIMLNKGKIIIQGEINELKKTLSKKTIKITLNESIEHIKDKLRINNISSYVIIKEGQLNKLVLFTNNNNIFYDLKLSELEFQQHNTTLDDVFVYYASNEIGD